MTPRKTYRVTIAFKQTPQRGQRLRIKSSIFEVDAFNVYGAYSLVRTMCRHAGFPVRELTNAEEQMTADDFALQDFVAWVQRCPGSRLRVWPGFVGLLHAALHRGLLHGTTERDGETCVFVKQERATP